MNAMTMTKLLTMLMAAASLCDTALAQPAGVNPEGATDLMTAQLAGGVTSVKSITWSVDYSRHTVVKAQQTVCTADTYGPDGNIRTRQTFDADGQPDTKTIFQYTDSGEKRVSTTYSATGERTLQTLYAYTADGFLARMRFTDAAAVTISTTEVSVMPTWTQTAELFKDGEKVVTTYTYDANLRLIGISKKDGLSHSELKLSLGYDGLPARGTYSASFGHKATMTYEHTVDSHGNWTRRVTYADGVATEVTERTIEYLEE